MTTWIKICGITRAQDLALVSRAGADAAGLVFVPDSPRHLSPEAAASLGRQRPAGLALVALLMDADAGAVERAIAAAGPDLLQFHGSEDPAFCAGFGLPYIKAVPMHREDREVIADCEAHAGAYALLFDGHGVGEMGGSGRRFDASRLPDLHPRSILAGGMEVGNVAAAVRATGAWGVDVSSGVERTPGVKDQDAVVRFVKEVRDVG